MWNLLASEVSFEIVPLSELRKYLKKSNVILVDIKPLNNDQVIVFYKDLE